MTAVTTMPPLDPDAEAERLLAVSAGRQPKPSSRLARAQQIASGQDTTPTTPRRAAAPLSTPPRPSAEADRLMALYRQGRGDR